ncbi:MAG TPA: nitronate monooxygenase, partial [Anaerolineae bacterium]
EESGMQPEYRQAILREIKNGTDQASLVRTTLFSPTGFPFKVVQLGKTLSDSHVFEDRHRVCDIGLLQQLGLGKPSQDGSRMLFQRCPASPTAAYVRERGLESNTGQRRCLCNGLLSCVGLGQTRGQGESQEEPAIITLGNHLEGVRRLSRRGQARYWARDAVADILGDTAE